MSDALKVELRHNMHHLSLEVSATFPAGCTIIEGPSASGKTSILKLIVGIMHAEHAHISLGNQVWNDTKTQTQIPTQARHVGYVPQRSSLFPHLNVLANIAFGSPNTNVSQWIQLFELEPIQYKFPMELSGGEAQVVSLVRAAARQPNAWFLDEAFASMDHQLKMKTLQRLAPVLKKVPSLLVSHGADEANILSCPSVTCHNGKIIT
jgi:molybdate transport system ATP-binding protein